MVPELSFKFVEYSNFQYWFEYNFDTHRYNIINRAAGIEVGSLTEGSMVWAPELFITEGMEPLADRPVILAEWKDFVEGRPEYVVGRPVLISNNTAPGVMIADNKRYYDRYLCGVTILAGQEIDPSVDPDKWMPYKCLNWLNKTDFYHAPASGQYHDSFDGGLCYHTLQVLSNTIDLIHANKFKDVPVYKAARVALVHDWCKIGYYESYTRNVKNDATGQWEKVVAFKKRETTTTTFGHGASSMFLAQQFFRLGMDEALAIRWHMGEYNVAPNEMNELHQANALYPICYLIQFADRLACTEY